MVIMDNGNWHLDKRVPISLILALLGQFLIGLWFVSKLDARVYALELNLIVQRERDTTQDTQRENSFQMLRSDLRDMSAKLDRLIENGNMKFGNGKH